MRQNVQTYGAVAFLLIMILALRIWDAPFSVNSGSVDAGQAFSTQTSFLTNPQAIETDRPADRPIRTLRDISNAMVDVADMVNPTVVTVFTERTVQVRRNDPFGDLFGFNHPFFRQFENPQPQEFQQSGQGSGVIVSADGFIITNAHVILNADTVKVRMINNRIFPARVVGADPNTDIAVLKIEGADLPSIRIGDSDNLRVGEWVMAVGSPLAENLAHTVTQGIVSAKGRSGFNLLELEDFIQTDAAINPGNSGGALINLDGELVGINTAIASRTGGFQGIGLAIPVNIARNVMRSLIETGSVTRGYIGVSIQEIDDTMARAFDLLTPEGVLVAEIVEDSPAQRAGLREGDVILEADRRKMSNTSQFRAYVASKMPGDTIQLNVLREGRNETIQVVVGVITPEQAAAAAGARGLMDRTGFAVGDLTPEKMQQLNIRSGVRGVLVEEIDEESAAYRNNLRRNDVIMAVNRRAVRNTSEFNQLVATAEAGQVILLQVLRGRQTTFIAFEMK
jgi:serine protease Do